MSLFWPLKNTYDHMVYLHLQLRNLCFGPIPPMFEELPNHPEGRRRERLALVRLLEKVGEVQARAAAS